MVKPNQKRQKKPAKDAKIDETVPIGESTTFFIVIQNLLSIFMECLLF